MESKNYIIYKFTNRLNGKVYVGLTCRGFELRKYEHIHESQSDSRFKFHQAIRKHTIDNFIWEILESDILSIKEANERERYYIQLFDSYVNGYNMTKGGGGRENHTISEVTRERMRQAKLGVPRSQESKDKQSKKLKGIPKSETHRINAANAKIGVKLSAKAILNMSKGRLGKYTGATNPSAIKINIYDAEGVLKYQCNGDFEKICRENSLPTKALRKSYYNNGNPIYTSQKIKKEVLTQNKYYIKWYAIKIFS